LSEIPVGSYVTHSRRPEWGLGKVFCRNTPYVLVGFRDVTPSDRFKRLDSSFLLLADSDGDEVLDSWLVDATPDCHQVIRVSRSKGKTPAGPPVALWTLDQAFDRFLLRYPGGFQDPGYGPRERDWKWSKHLFWQESISPGGFRALASASPRAAADLITKLIQTKKALLHPQGELVVLRDALHREEFVSPYLASLANLLEASTITSDLFDAHYQALTSLPLLRSGNLVKWTIVTIVPFLAQPTRQMFLKPTKTEEIARLLGFNLLYSPTPRWDTYERLLELSQRLFEFLQPYGAQDMIDVQSFIWVVTAPYPNAE
jgi:hypothetical protein